MNFLQTGCNAQYYIDGVIDAWRRRNAVLLGQQLAQGDGSNLVEITQKLQALPNGSDLCWLKFESFDSLPEE